MYKNVKINEIILYEIYFHFLIRDCAIVISAISSEILNYDQTRSQNKTGYMQP